MCRVTKRFIGAISQSGLFWCALPSVNMLIFTVLKYTSNVLMETDQLCGHVMSQFSST